MPTFYEFFAGGGMARLGLGPAWTCLFANDIDARKALSYRRNHGAGGELTVADIRAVSVADLPGVADLMWGSFPCQDLSLAGAGAGLGGARSGSVHPFWDIVEALAADGRAPRVVALENVCGTLTARHGEDFNILRRRFHDAGYRCGALIINANLFVPQSRPRLFMIGVRQDVAIDPALLTPGPALPFHSAALQRAVGADVAGWLWWRLPLPKARTRRFADDIEAEPADVAWSSPAETQRLLAMMSPANLAKVEAARRAGAPLVGSVYRRTRREDGASRQRAEVRFDEVAGCLRTPAGGSSRQTIIVVEGSSVRSRLISAREAARLMGLEDSYILPGRYNEAYHLAGDGVVVPVVRHLARHLLEPLARSSPSERRAA